MPEAGDILIADDDKVSLSLTAGLLEKQGYTCTCVLDGDHAQELLQHHHYDLLISDIKMPGNFELDLIKSLSQRAWELPVLLVTGQPSLDSALQSIHLSVSGYLVKPFAPDELLTQVRTAIANTRAANALRESEQRYRNLFDHASDALATVTLNGIITDVNTSLESMLGYTRQELRGQHYRSFIGPASATRLEEETRRMPIDNATDNASTVAPIRCELELVHKDGHRVPVEALNCPIRAQDGSPIGFQGSYRDISIRKALEQQRAELLAMVTHDIRNPLGVILGYTQMLIEGMREQGDEHETHILERILCNTLTVHSLVANYLDLSKIETGNLSIAKQPVELNPILEQVRTKYETAARHSNIQLELSTQDALPAIPGDALALERVFANLVSNALKFTPENGHVTLCSSQENGSIVASVSDTGPGMAAEEIPHLFEKYRRAKKDHSKEGIGLGLFIVQTLVNQHNGRIVVESTPGQGSCFQIFLPIATHESD